MLKNWTNITRSAAVAANLVLFGLSPRAGSKACIDADRHFFARAMFFLS